MALRLALLTITILLIISAIRRKWHAYLSSRSSEAASRDLGVDPSVIRDAEFRDVTKREDAPS